MFNHISIHTSILESELHQIISFDLNEAIRTLDDLGLELEHMNKQHPEYQKLFEEYHEWSKEKTKLVSRRDEIQNLLLQES